MQPLANNEMHASGSWNKREVVGALDGSELVSTQRDDSVRFTVTGRSVSWVTTRGPKRGVADVYVDGRLKASIDLKADTVLPARAVWAYKLPLGSSHRIKIVNRSPKGRTAVGLDAILVQA